MLEKAVANDPLYLNGSRCLVVAYVLEGNHKAALATCNTVLSLSPDFHPIYYQIGITLAAQGRTPEAIAAFEKGLSIGAGDQILEAALGMACAGEIRNRGLVARTRIQAKQRKRGLHPTATGEPGRR